MSKTAVNQQFCVSRAGLFVAHVTRKKHGSERRAPQKCKEAAGGSGSGRGGAVMNPWVTIDGCNYQMDGFKSSLIDVISSMSDY